MNTLPKRYRSFLILGIFFAFILYGLIACYPTANLGVNYSNGEDIKCYRAIVKRIQGGETYYSAAAQELRSRGYATASVFNWRLPLLAWFLSRFSSLAGPKLILFIIAIISLFLWLKTFMRSGYAPWQIVMGGQFVFSPMIAGMVSDLCFMHEFWTGTIIVLSLAIYSRGYYCGAAFIGATALFLRELALPFVLLMLLLALVEKRRREALVWGVGIAVFCLEFFVHWSAVNVIITEVDNSLPGGWIVFGGWPFVLKTAQMHLFLIFAPAWLVAIIIPFTLLGFTGIKNSLELRIASTVIAYMLAFAFVGKPFNAYWGLIYSSLMLMGLLTAPREANRLFKEIWDKG